jgi:hypothetical protein
VARICAYPNVIALYRNACPMNSENPRMVRRGYCLNMVLAMVMNPIVWRCRMVMDCSGSGSSAPVSRSTRCSIPSTSFSASRSRPWMNSQRGLSGTLRRTSSTTTPRTTPSPKHSRQPTLTDRSLVAGTVSSAPAAAPAQ